MESLQDPKDSPQRQDKIKQAIALEREAHRLRSEGKIDQAFQTFDHAAKLFEETGEPLRSAVCYASAATCWNIHTGWQPLKNAATRSELAAVQAFKAKDYAYAGTLFSEAALLYEKEGNFTKYSDCYERAKNAELLLFWNTLTGRAEKIMGAQSLISGKSLPGQLKLAFQAFFSLVSGIIWGHGERPFRTLVIMGGVIVGCALVYMSSGLVSLDGAGGGITFGNSLYFSIIAYSTVGFGDFLPVGWVRAVAAFEALCGILLTPLFLVALTRRYLRISR